MPERLSVRRFIRNFIARGQELPKVSELESMVSIKNSEIEILRGKLAELQELARFEKDLVPVPNAYTVLEGKYSGSFFCSPCWDSDRKQIRLQEADEAGWYVCPECDRDALVQPQQRIRATKSNH
jgi:hypothetical protein